MTSGLTIRDLTSQHLPAVVEIADAQLGSGYFSGDPAVYLPKPGDTIFRVALDAKGHVVGFCYSKHVPQSEINSYLKLETLPDVFQDADPIAVLKTVAVRSGNKGQGVGTQLVKDTLAQMRADDARLVACVAWRQGDTGRVNISGLMDHFGFRKIKSTDDYWKPESLESGFICPACGSPPCRCGAVMYSKALA